MTLRELEELGNYFDSTETPSLQRQESATSLTAIGTVAPKALNSQLLSEAFSARGLQPFYVGPFSGFEGLSANQDWTLGLVLSPYKLAACEICDALAPAAERSGVVDTILRSEDGKVYGFNTNIFGALRVISLLTGGAAPNRCLILGTGASARSCIVALRLLYEDTEVGVKGRDIDRTSGMANKFSVATVEDISGYDPELTINATTVGESEDSDPSYSVEDVLRPGNRFFDLNNRTSKLQHTALSQGCVTASGVMMQISVNFLRARLASH